MDFSWDDDQLKLKNSVIHFAEKELNTDLLEHDKGGIFARDNWIKCAEFGIQGTSMPKAFNGQDSDIMSALLVMEALGYGCRDNGLNFGLNAQMWTVQLPILDFGSAAQKENYLPGLCDGSLIGSHAITEAEAGSDLFSLTTFAEKTQDGYVLNGTKKFVTLGPVADFALVFATVDPGKGRWGITAFLVDFSSSGISVGPVKEKMGLRTVPFADLVMKDCYVPDEARLGPEGAGVSISSHSLEWERCCILASQLGAMSRQLEISIKYARTRRQFDKPIGKFQSVSNRIANMKLRLETSRLLVYKAAWLKKSGKSSMMEAAMAKLQLSECFTESSLDAIRIHGGKGYMTETEVERDLRDAIGGILYGGTSDIQRNIISGLLGV